MAGIRRVTGRQRRRSLALRARRLVPGSGFRRAAVPDIAARGRYRLRRRWCGSGLRRAVPGRQAALRAALHEAADRAGAHRTAVAGVAAVATAAVAAEATATDSAANIVSSFLPLGPSASESAVGPFFAVWKKKQLRAGRLVYTVRQGKRTASVPWSSPCPLK